MNTKATIKALILAATIVLAWDSECWTNGAVATIEASGNGGVTWNIVTNITEFDKGETVALPMPSGHWWIMVTESNALGISSNKIIERRWPTVKRRMDF